MQDVISQVGNYGEVYETNLVPIGLEREGTLNALWTDGGLIYSPPFR
jgi:general L-amino acid transport system substrate-binding protein